MYADILHLYINSEYKPYFLLNGLLASRDKGIKHKFVAHYCLD